jgi:hypothetical protein
VLDLRIQVCSKTQEGHREDAKGRKREKPKTLIHNDLDDFALFIVEFIPMNIGTLSPQGSLGTSAINS